MSVLFVSPAKTYPIDKTGRPLEVKRSNMSLPALAILGSLKQNGYETDFIDLAAEGFNSEERIDNNTIRFGLPDEAVVDRIRDNNPSALLITSMFSTEQRMVDNLAEKVKESYPKLPIIVGGVHASIRPEWHLETGNIDFIVCGEGEAIIPELLGDIVTKGVCKTKNEKGQIIRAERISDLNLLWDFEGVLFRGTKNRYLDQQTRKHPIYQQKKQGTLSFSLYYSRGCPIHCDYCATSERDGNKIRHMGSERMFSDFQVLYEKYGIRTFYNQSDTFGSHPEDIEFLKMVGDYRREHPDFIFNNPNAFFVRRFFPKSKNYELDDGLLDIFANAGFNVITLAMETFNQRFNKKIDLRVVQAEQVRDLVSAIRGRGIKSNIYMMYGFPEQTSEELRYDEKRANECNADLVSWYRCTILPGTSYYQEAISKGWFTEYEYREKLYDTYRFSSIGEDFNFSNISGIELKLFSQRIENSA